MKHNGREIYNSKVTKYLVDKNSSACMIDIVGAKKAKYKEELKSSKSYVSDQNARNIAQVFTQDKDVVVSDLSVVSDQVCKDILKAFATKLKITSKSKKADNYMQPNISFEQIEEMIVVYLPVLKKLKAICYNAEVALVDKNFSLKYKKLFDSLIELDIRFAYFAPKACLNKSAVVQKIEALPADHQNRILELKARLEKDESLDYVATEEIKQVELDKNSESVALVDAINEAEFKAKFDMVKSTENLSISLYQFILKELNLQDYDEEHLKVKEIEDILRVCSIGLKALKNSSKSKQLNEIAGWDNFDPYTELFNRLIDINIKFAFVAPKSSLNRFDINFKMLSEQERFAMLSILKDYGLWDNHEYVEVYGPLFKFDVDLKV